MGCDGRSGWSAGAYAAAWASEAVAAIGSGVGALGWEVIASLPPGRLVVGVDAAHRDQGQTQVADLGEQAVQGRLVADRAGDGGLAGRARRC
jgi:hypothetical protein